MREKEGERSAIEDEEVAMRAQAGDQIRVKSHRVGAPDRCGEVVEARGPNGGPPLVVRWDDTGHETLFFPGSDAVVEGPTSAVASS
jgi:hypothetical protein